MNDASQLIGKTVDAVDGATVVRDLMLEIVMAPAVSLDVPANSNDLAHRDDDMTCVSCHSSWMTSCFGCHLSMQANRKMPNRHNEGGNTRNFTQYNFQVLRDDIFMLGRDGTVTGNRVAPVRSSSAVLVSSPLRRLERSSKS